MNEMSITSQVPLTEGHTFKGENGQGPRQGQCCQAMIMKGKYILSKSQSHKHVGSPNGSTHFLKKKKQIWI